MASIDTVRGAIEDTAEDLCWAKAAADQHDGRNEARNAEVARLEAKLARLRRWYREAA